MKYLIALVITAAVIGYGVLIPVGMWKGMDALWERRFGKALAWFLPLIVLFLVVVAMLYAAALLSLQLLE